MDIRLIVIFAGLGAVLGQLLSRPEMNGELDEKVTQQKTSKEVDPESVDPESVDDSEKPVDT